VANLVREARRRDGGLKRVLNVGGNRRSISLPPQYAGFEQVLLDIDPKVSPDIVCDARELASLDVESFDAVYCSHNLEHYYRHEVPVVLRGFQHVLKGGGVAHVRVPDLGELMRVTMERGLDVEDVLYESAVGPIQVLDVLYGYGAEIERSGTAYFAHRTGFTHKSLLKALGNAGFSKVYSSAGNLEINAMAFKGNPDPQLLSILGLPHG
jgi:hypothetical protein